MKVHKGSMSTTGHQAYFCVAVVIIPCHGVVTYHFVLRKKYDRWHTQWEWRQQIEFKSSTGDLVPMHATINSNKAG